MRYRMARATYPQTRWATSTSAYLVLLRVEIARFTLKVSLQTRLCCSDPRLTADGSYPLRCPLESRLSSVQQMWHSDRLACFTPAFYPLHALRPPGHFPSEVNRVVVVDLA